MRILLAHPKGWSPSDIASALAAIRARYPGHDVISGRDSYLAMASALGGYTEWATWCGAGMAADGRPSYNVILIPGTSCGRAVAQIVEAALVAGRSVFAVGDGGELDRAEEVIGVHVSIEDWKHGSYVVVDRDCDLGTCESSGCGKFQQQRSDGGLCPIHAQAANRREGHHDDPGGDDDIPF